MLKALRFLGWPALVGVLLALLIIQRNPEWVGLPEQEVHLQQAPLLSRLQQGPGTYADAVTRAAPAVANLYTTKMVSRPGNSMLDDPLFRRFFGDNLPQQKRMESSLGSAVIMSPEGYLLTNNHVTAGADQIVVALRDGRETTARLVGSDPETDLAVLKIDLKDLPVMTLGRSDGIRTGDVCLAIGNPFGVGQTVTSGIVSALGRTHLGINTFENFIQTDAAINPGNSGGALINMAGQLIGINTAIYSRSGGSIGIGFAIPSNMVRAFADAAKSGSDFFERPYIGAEFEAVTPQIAESLGMDAATGALVSSVVPDGPAAKAGLKPGDVVLTLNGTPVEGVEALDYRMATLSIGAGASFGILSKGQQQTVDVTLERPPEGAKSEQVMLRGRSPFAGAKVAELSPRLAQRLGTRTDEKGVAVVDVSRDSPAADFGFQPGDIVREVNGTTIDSAEKLAEVSQQNTRWWRFTVERNGQILRQVLRY